MTLAAIRLSAEITYKTHGPINIIVRRNKVLRSGIADNICFSTNSYAAIDIHNTPYTEAKNIQILDNTVIDSCLDGIALSSGSYVENVTVAGNTFINQRWGCRVSTNSDIFFIENRVENSTLNSMVMSSYQNNIMIEGNSFVNAITTKQGRTQVVYITSAGRVQFSNNSYSQYVSTGSTIMLNVISANSILNTLQQTSLISVIPSNTTSFSLPNITDFEFEIESSNFPLTESQILSTLSLDSSYSLLTAFSAINGTVELTFDRSSLTFKLLNSSNTGSFKYTIQSKTEMSIKTAKITLIRKVTTPTLTSSRVVNTIVSVLSDGVVIHHQIFLLTVIFFLISFTI